MTSRPWPRAPSTASCAACASARCPAEEVQYNIAILARRLYARHLVPKAEHLAKAVKAVEDKTFDKALRELKKKSLDELKKLYKGLEIEPDMAEESWTPRTSPSWEIEPCRTRLN